MSPYTFEKIGPLIHDVPEMPMPGPYYTCLVPMSAVAGFPFDYALYFSTDHQPGLGGVWLYLCQGDPSVAENWQSYDEAYASGVFDHLLEKPFGNPIFQDEVQGWGHTETPHANVIDGVVYLTYHKNRLNGQSTLLATSRDGINFTRIHGEADSVILRNEEAAGKEAHTGYFRWGPNPFPAIQARYLGYSLYVGGANYKSAQWTSDDAINWQLRTVFDSKEGLGLEDPDKLIIWHEIDPNLIQKDDHGNYRALVCVGNRASGSEARLLELYTIYLNEDGTAFTRPAESSLSTGQFGSFDSEELGSPTSCLIDGKVYLLYVGASQQGRLNTVMGAIECAPVD